MGILSWLVGLFRKKAPPSGQKALERKRDLPEIREPTPPDLEAKYHIEATVRRADEVVWRRTALTRGLKPLRDPGLRRMANRSKRLRTFQRKSGFDFRKKMVDLEEE